VTYYCRQPVQICVKLGQVAIGRKVHPYHNNFPPLRGHIAASSPNQGEGEGFRATFTNDGDQAVHVPDPEESARDVVRLGRHSQINVPLRQGLEQEILRPGGVIQIRLEEAIALDTYAISIASSWPSAGPLVGSGFGGRSEVGGTAPLLPYLLLGGGVVVPFPRFFLFFLSGRR